MYQTKKPIFICGEKEWRNIGNVFARESLFTYKMRRIEGSPAELQNYLNSYPPDIVVIIEGDEEGEEFEFGSRYETFFIGDKNGRKSIAYDTLASLDWYLSYFLYKQNLDQAEQTRRRLVLDSITRNIPELQRVLVAGNVQKIQSDNFNSLGIVLNGNPRKRDNFVCCLPCSDGCLGFCRMCNSRFHPFKRVMTTDEMLGQLRAVFDYTFLAEFFWQKSFSLYVSMTAQGDLLLCNNLANFRAFNQRLHAIPELGGRVKSCVSSVGNEKIFEFLEMMKRGEITNTKLMYSFLVDPKLRAEILPATAGQDVDRIRDGFGCAVKISGEKSTFNLIAGRGRGQVRSIKILERALKVVNGRNGMGPEEFEIRISRITGQSENVLSLVDELRFVSYAKSKLYEADLFIAEGPDECHCGRTVN